MHERKSGRYAGRSRHALVAAVSVRSLELQPRPVSTACYGCHLVGRNNSTFARGHPPGENPLNYESWRIYATDTTARRDSILLLKMEEAYWTLSRESVLDLWLSGLAADALCTAL